MAEGLCLRVWKFLPIACLNLCFVREVGWDSGACPRAEATCGAVCLCPLCRGSLRRVFVAPQGPQGWCTPCKRGLQRDSASPESRCVTSATASLGLSPAPGGHASHLNQNWLRTQKEGGEGTFQQTQVTKGPHPVVLTRVTSSTHLPWEEGGKVRQPTAPAGPFLSRRPGEDSAVSAQG